MLFILPGWNLFFHGFPDMSANENRKLAAFPDIRKNVPDSFAPAFDSWVNDHFSFRNLLLNNKMYFDIHVLQQSPIPSYVIIGKDNWLYNTGHEIEVYRGVNRFTETELQSMLEEMRYRQKFIESHRAKMYYAITPVKYSVYPEYLPLNLKQVNSESRTDQFANYMKGKGMHVLDFRKALILAKSDTFPVFYKGDNHWNYNGAFMAYQLLIDSLQKDFPAVGKMLKFSDYSISRKPRLSGNLSKMLFLANGCGELEYTYTRKSHNHTKVDTNEIYKPPASFNYPASYEERYSNGDPRSLKILIIRDSFGYYITQFLKEHFRETVSIFDAWEYKLNPEIIEKEKPDIVLFLVLESFTDSMLDYQARGKSELKLLRSSGVENQSHN